MKHQTMKFIIWWISISSPIPENIGNPNLYELVYLVDFTECK